MPAKCLTITLALAACAQASRNDSDPPLATNASPTAKTSPAVESAYLIRGEPRANRTPGWSAVRFGNELLLRSPTSAGWHRVALPAARALGRVQSYAADRLRLTVEPGACALREAYPNLPDRIRLDWDGGHFEGCGGPRTPPAGIAGTTWELARIGGKAAPSGRSPAATLVFGENGALGGTLNCNDGGIQARWTGAGSFVPGRERGFLQTAIGCPDPPLEAFGRRFWNGMESARSWRRDGERLLVIFDDGTQAELRFLL